MPSLWRKRKRLPVSDAVYSNEEIPALVKSLTEACERDKALSSTADHPMKAGGFLGRAVQNARLAASLLELSRLRAALAQRDQATCPLCGGEAQRGDRRVPNLSVSGAAPRPTPRGNPMTAPTQPEPYSNEEIPGQIECCQMNAEVRRDEGYPESDWNCDLRLAASLEELSRLRAALAQRDQAIRWALASEK